MTAALATLNQAALVTLADCEQRIERGLKTFIDVGQALAEIRDSRLYRGTHGTFEEYCQERWGFNRHRAAQLIGALDVVTNVTSAGLPAPNNEGQARALAAVPEADRADVWRDVVESGDKPTAAAIRKAAEARTQPPSPGPTGAALSPPADPGATPAPAADAPAPSQEPGGVAAEPTVEDRVAAALDQHVPDPGAPARAWAKKFYELASPVHNLLLWLKPEDVAAYADEQDVTTLKHLATSFADAHRRAVEAMNANVTPLRRIK